MDVYGLEIDDQLYLDRSDSFAYEAANPLFKTRYSQSYGPYGTPNGWTSEVKHFNSDGHPDTVSYYISNPFNPGS